MEQTLTVIDKKFYEPLKQDWIAQSNLSEADFLREVSFAVQHLHKSPYLQKASPQSVLKAVMNLAQVGLTLNPISKYAALVPRWNKDSKQVECVLEPMYQGLSKLLTDSGAVKSVQCELIYEGDEIEIDKASEDKVKKHIPYYLKGNKKGKIIAVYSLATLADGAKHFEGMSFDEVCEIRDRSESYKSFKDGKIKTCIWVTDEGEMFRKTVFKRHTKWLPKSEASEKLQTAVDLDNQLHGFDEAIDFGLLSWIETMIGQATLDSDQKEKLLKRLTQIEFKSQGYKLIDELKEYAPILGLHSTPHGVEDIGKAARYMADKDDLHEQRFKK